MTTPSKNPPSKKRKGKQRVPRTRAGNTFTESGYWGFIRSGLRSKWVRYPPRFQTLNEAKRRVSGKRWKWEYQCALCEGWFQTKEVEVDHIDPCGSLKCKEDIEGFVTRLFCEPEGLRVVCKPCHKERTQEEKQ